MSRIGWNRQLAAYLGLWALAIIAVTLAQESRIQTKVEREVTKQEIVLTPCLKDNRASQLACDALAQRITPRVVKALTDRQVREIGRRITARRVRRTVERELRRRERSRSGKEPPDKSPSGKRTGARMSTTASGGPPVTEPEAVCSVCLVKRLRSTIQALVPSQIVPLLSSVEPTL